MADDGTPYPLQQMTLHHSTTDYGQAQHEYSSLLKGELLDQVLTLPFGILPSSVNASDLVGQLLEVCLGRIPCMVHILDLSSKLAGLPSNKGQ
jgi:hypothetical protein